MDGNLALVQKILQSPYCSPLDARNTAGQTVLHDASFMGDAQIVEKLLEGGANVNCKDSNCVTPLHVSIARVSGKYNAKVKFNIDWSPVFIRKDKDTVQLY